MESQDEALPMTDEPDDCGTLTATTQGNGWQTETEFCQFGTADIFDDYAARSTPMRMLTGFHAFMNIVFTGTLWRYLTTSWRFVMFFMWPFVLSIILIAVAALIAYAPILQAFRSGTSFGPCQWQQSLQLCWSAGQAIAFHVLSARRLVGSL